MAGQKGRRGAAEKSASSFNGSRAEKPSKKGVFQRIKRRAAAWGMLLLSSICIYKVAVFAGLPKLFPSASGPRAHPARTELTKFLEQALTGVALPLVPSRDFFYQAAVIVGPYGKTKLKNMLF